MESHSRIYSPLTADGSFYIARMLFSISSHKLQTTSSKKITSRITSHTSLQLLSDVGAKNEINLEATTEFVAYVVINEAIMIDARYRNELLSFKLTVGE